MLLLGIGLCCGGLQASGGSQVETAPIPKTPEEQARERYNQGLSYRDEAWRFIKKLANPNTPEAKRAKMETKIGRAYDAAAREFSYPVRVSVSIHAWTGRRSL